MAVQDMSNTINVYDCAVTAVFLCFDKQQC